MKKTLREIIISIICIALFFISLYYGFGILLYGGMKDIGIQVLNIFSSNIFLVSEVCLGIGKILFAANLIGISFLIIISTIIPQTHYVRYTTKLPIGRK